MAAIPFALSTSPGTNAQESGGRLINCFAEPIYKPKKKGGTPQAKWVRCPGMTSFLTSAQTGFRGTIEVSGVLYVAFEDALYRGTSAGGGMTLHGVLSGSEPVYFARNNALTPDIVVVTENGAFTISGVSTIDPYPDGDLPVPNSVCSLDGYFVFTIGDGRAFASGLNVTSVDSLSFGQAEAKPDALVRGVAFGGRLYLFGTETLEIWNDVGTAPFPFQRAVTVPMGLIAPGAVAGQEDGFAATLMFVAQDGTVRQMDGYAATKVSPSDLDRLIQDEENKDALLASVYMVDGHPMWSIKGTNFTWVFDIGTQKWHERRSYLVKNWRGRQTLRAFERWLVGDDNTGNIYEIDPNNHMEGDDPLIFTLESGPVDQFPNVMRVNRADFNMVMGTGIATGEDPMQTNPEVRISWTDDGGINWHNPRLLKIGRQAMADNLVSMYNTGLTGRQGRRWRLEISDAVYVSVMGGTQEQEMRR